MSDIFDDIVNEIEEKEPFIVDTYEKAEWAVTKIAKAQRNIDQRTAHVRALKNRLDDRLAELNKADLDTIDWFAHEIEPYVQNEIEGSKKKSVKFVFGTAGYRAAGGGIDIVDEDACLRWLETNGYDEAINKTPIKSEIKRIGDVPGTVTAEKVDRFYIKTDTELLLDS